MQENFLKKLTFHFYCLKPYNFVELLMEGEESRIAEENFFFFYKNPSKH